MAREDIALTFSLQKIIPGSPSQIHLLQNMQAHGEKFLQSAGGIHGSCTASSNADSGKD